ncbi:MAG: metallophosphoesterase [Bifidobacteriaceae bacterium]|jgi:hypothetical protein|nr:metallophosphoesterase [Bifidobacteriaceae bacterium]
MRRRILAWCLYGLLLAVPALLVGLTTARTEYSFGPHEAVYEVTVDSSLTVDLGPLGSAVVPSPLPGPLGFIGGRVEVGVIPADLTTTQITIGSLVQDLADYGQAYMGIDKTLRQAVENLIKDGLIRAGIIWALALILTVAVMTLMGRSRRTQIEMWSGRHRRLVAGLTVGAMALGLVGAGGVVASARARPEPAPEPLLEGTPLAGAHLTGRLGQLLGQYGRVAVDAYEADAAFYRDASANVEKAFAAQAKDAAERAAAGRQDQESPAGVGAAGAASPAKPGTAGVPSQSGAAGAEPSAGYGTPSVGEGSGPSEEPVPSAPDSPSAVPPWEEGDGPYGDLMPVLFFSDLHCNIGMAQVMGAAARGLDTRLVLDGGDSTMDGTAVERYCIDQISASIPDKAAWVVSPGNHDTRETAKQERSAGARVLDGKVLSVAGLRILGDADPAHTEAGQGTSLVGEENMSGVAKRLAETACANSPVDLLLVHEPALAEAALNSGCVPAAITGHTHARANPKAKGEGILYTQASTGRDNSNTTTLGPLANPAELTVLLFDSDGRIVAWQLLTVRPDASAELSAIKAWPEPPERSGMEDKKD